MKNNKVLAVIIIILLIVIAVLLINSKKSDIAYNPQSPSAQNSSPAPTPSPIPSTTPNTSPTPNPTPTPTPKPCSTTSGGSLENQYNNLKCQYSFKFATYSTALNAFKNATDSQMEVARIDFYVAGKLPREDGNPYFIGYGTVNASANDCIGGYMNLVTGVIVSHRNPCAVN
jgi:hypothetical protein